MVIDVDLALVVLYRELTPDIDPDQIGTGAQVGLFADTGVEDALTALAASLDLATRQDRYAGALGYVLGVRLLLQTNSFEPEVSALGQTLLGVFPEVADPEGAELELRDAMQRLLAVPEVTSDVETALENAFSGALQIAPAGGGTVTYSGSAAEMATMLTELATMSLKCHSRGGTVTVGGEKLDVTLLEFEICTHAPFARCRGGVDPRHWPAYNPSFFQSVDVISGSPAPTGNWSGVVQEKVGPLMSGTPIVTNLMVSYVEQPGLAVTAYDLAPDNAALPPDDGRVTVDYGFVSVADVGAHRRFRVLKVVRVEEMPMPHSWLCPLWAQQLVMAGWWS